MKETESGGQVFYMKGKLATAFLKIHPSALVQLNIVKANHVRLTKNVCVHPRSSS